jgi:hypothetical protein
MGIPLLSDSVDYLLENAEHALDSRVPVYRFSVNLPLVNDLMNAVQGLAGNKKTVNLYNPTITAIEALTAIPADNALKIVRLKDEAKEVMKIRK